ncbi:MAG: succinate dehydrogenase/fumarate reductase flavoprotein subunit, partial [SAR324 cluster bacterium]|nr:succinate dehydrogenase/fumarate reductase flavoprotein subunit [SAR324 cluster bacterium]
ENFLDVSEMVVCSAIARKESRGAHYRSDFTDQDDEGYLCNFILTRDDPTPRKQQVAMPRLRPGG